MRIRIPNTGTNQFSILFTHYVTLQVYCSKKLSLSLPAVVITSYCVRSSTLSAISCSSAYNDLLISLMTHIQLDDLMICTAQIEMRVVMCRRAG